MQVFTSPSHTLHVPKFYLADGTTRPCPDHPARVPNILIALTSAGHTITTLDPSPNPPPALAHIHTPDYLHYLQTIHSHWTTEFGPDVNVLPDTFPRFRPSHPAHPQRPASPLAQPGYYCFDMAAPITAGTWPAVLAGAQLATAAAAALQTHRTAYALCRPPGHHAGPDYCGGFCYLNNAALAAQHVLLAGHRRVALLDLDYHHGNGTQDIFYARPDVLFLSLHADPNTQYPYFWGHASETGAGAGLGFTHNFPLPRGTSESTWLSTLTRALQLLSDYQPEALIVSLGVDTYEHDTVGDFQLSLHGFHQAATLIAQLHLPTAIIQEGGYNLDAVGPCVEAFLQPFP